MVLQSNYFEYSVPQFRKLAPNQMERIHHASLEILDRTVEALAGGAPHENIQRPPGNLI